MRLYVYYLESFNSKWFFTGNFRNGTRLYLTDHIIFIGQHLFCTRTIIIILFVIINMICFTQYTRHTDSEL